MSLYDRASTARAACNDYYGGDYGGGDDDGDDGKDDVNDGDGERVGDDGESPLVMLVVVMTTMTMIFWNQNVWNYLIAQWFN